ncbi:MAG: ATP-binding cassette domain-containing protein [Bacteroidaceae bacterium]|nr:ATP-binding cassette domain-containing protein [Bacteroidaceae bacterium]
MLIEYKNVEVYQETQEVLRDVTFSVDEGEFVYIIGKVGSGKSSLLKTLYGELPIHSGEAHVMEYDMASLRRKHLPELRRKLGIIFQDFQLLTDRTVDANLRFVLKATGWKNKVEIDDRIKEVLTLVGMETKGYKLPSELSGGEQQRIAIARAILNNPKLILADEPTGNLDADTSRLITELLHKIVKEQGVTVLMITHNLHLVERYPERTFECKDKALVEIKHANKKLLELQAEIDDDKEALDENADADMEIIEDIEHLEEPTDIEEEDNDEQEEGKGEKQKPAYHEADFEILEDLE